MNCPIWVIKMVSRKYTLISLKYPKFCVLFSTFKIQGCSVVIASRDIKKLDAASQQMASFGKITALQCNIRKEEDIR